MIEVLDSQWKVKYWVKGSRAATLNRGVQVGKTPPVMSHPELLDCYVSSNRQTNHCHIYSDPIIPIFIHNAIVHGHI